MSTFERPTRRDVLRGGAVIGGGLFAGCSAGETTPTSRDAGGGGDTPVDTPTETTTPTPDPSYEVCMEPVGCLAFDRPPESVAYYFPGYADMTVALGHADAINSVGFAARYHTDAYDELDGVGVNKDDMTELISENGIDKEIFYELGSDLHFIDPNWLTQNPFFGLEETDIDELTENQAPFVGNVIFRRTDTWHTYRYYTMYEAFEKVAAVYQERERYEAFRALHDDYVARVQAKLPPADDRPNALLCFAAGDEPEAFSPYRLTDKGTNKKQFRDLGIADALAGTGIEGLSTTERGQIDYETMLEVDPDVLLLRGHETKTEQAFRDTVVAFMRDHDTASELTAVQEDRVFRGGPIYAGPIHNLFLTERFATALFPDTYSGELFDRGRVAAIVTG